MPRLFSLLGLVLVTSVVSAHFPFLVPDGPNKGRAVFSDTLKPDKAVPVERIARTKLAVLAAGKAAELTWTHDKTANCYTFEVPGSGTRMVVGTTEYGVFQRGDSPPFLLTYYPKAIFGDLPAPEQATVGDRVPLELVPVATGGKLRFKAVAGGKPMAKTNVTVLVPGEAKSKDVTTDEAGLTPEFDKPGTYGAHVRQAAATAGEKDGKKYAEVRQYATLVVALPGK